MAAIIGSKQGDLVIAANALREGKLVALPTETVYGLGGNALLEHAVEQIYKVKGRPATDPLICHVDCLQRADEMWDRESDTKAIDLACTIGNAIWPGPLTIVCKAHPRLPNCVTGGSGFVGARIPAHPIALQLLHLVDFPVAAPSANTFGHVSPTTAQHVYDDLASRDSELLIIDGGSCEVGIESTVIKINNAQFVEVLRRGKISVSDIQAAIAHKYTDVTVEIRDTRSKYKSADAPMDGPGQLLTHYSPRVPASLITPASIKSVNVTESSAVIVSRGEESYPLSETVIIDFNGLLKQFMHGCKGYRDLSAHGSAAEACSDVFDALRWSEMVEGAVNVIFPFISEWPVKENEELLAAVEDRLFRAASGTTAILFSNSFNKA